MEMLRSHSQVTHLKDLKSLAEAFCGTTAEAPEPVHLTHCNCLAEAAEAEAEPSPYYVRGFRRGSPSYVAGSRGAHMRTKPVTNRYPMPAQLAFDFNPIRTTPKLRSRSGRPPSRYLRLLGYVRQVFASTGQTPSYGMVCQALGLPDRADVRKLVIYGEKRGEICRGVGGRRIGLVEGVA